jgi:hypothetical protein
VKPLLFLAGLVMVLYLVSPYLGGGKIGLLWDMAIIGAKIPQLAMNANSSYTTMVYIYTFVTVIVLLIGIFGGRNESKGKRKK